MKLLLILLLASILVVGGCSILPKERYDRCIEKYPDVDDSQCIKKVCAGLGLSDYFGGGGGGFWTRPEQYCFSESGVRILVDFSRTNISECQEVIEQRNSMGKCMRYD